MPAPAFSKKENTPIEKSKRIAKALKDFWYFDKVYFPKAMYGDGFFKESWFHHEIAELTEKPGLHTVLAPREHAKTAVMKKRFIWKILRGDWSFVGIMSENLPQARRIMDSLSKLLSMNERIKNDFPHEIISDIMPTNDQSPRSIFQINRFFITAVLACSRGANTVCNPGFSVNSAIS
jgi:hypothetical protein